MTPDEIPPSAALPLPLRFMPITSHDSPMLLGAFLYQLSLPYIQGCMDIRQIEVDPCQINCVVYEPEADEYCVISYDFTYPPIPVILDDDDDE